MQCQILWITVYVGYMFWFRELLCVLVNFWHISHSTIFDCEILLLFITDPGYEPGSGDTSSGGMMPTVLFVLIWMVIAVVLFLLRLVWRTSWVGQSASKPADLIYHCISNHFLLCIPLLPVCIRPSSLRGSTNGKPALRDNEVCDISYALHADTHTCNPH